MFNKILDWIDKTFFPFCDDYIFPYCSCYNCFVKRISLEDLEKEEELDNDPS